MEPGGSAPNQQKQVKEKDEEFIKEENNELLRVCRVLIIVSCVMFRVQSNVPCAKYVLCAYLIGQRLTNQVRNCYRDSCGSSGPNS